MKNDILAESYILSAILNSNAIASDYIPKLKNSDFYDLNNQSIFSSIKKLFIKKEDLYPDKIAHDLTRHAKMPSPLQELEKLLALRGHICDIDYYYNILKENTLARELIYLCEQTISSVNSNRNAFDVQNDLHEKLSNSFEFLDRDFIAMSKVLQDFKDGKNFSEVVFQRMKDFAEGIDSFQGIRTGYKNLDSIIGGFANGTNNIIGARSSSGKTTFLCNLLINITTNNPSKKIGFFSLEMPRRRISEKLACALASVKVKSLEEGNLTLQEYERLQAVSKRKSFENIFFYDYSGVSITEIRTAVRRQIRKDSLDIVFIDYLSRIQSDRKYSNKHLEIDYVSKGLQDLALESEIPIVSLAQLNRQFALRADKRPVMSDLRESGSIEEDADLVLLMHRPAQHQTGVPDVTEVIVAKNRLLGDLGKIELEFNNGILQELPTLKQLQPYEVIAPQEKKMKGYNIYE